MARDRVDATLLLRSRGRPDANAPLVRKPGRSLTSTRRAARIGYVRATDLRTEGCGHRTEVTRSAGAAFARSAATDRSAHRRPSHCVAAVAVDDGDRAGRALRAKAGTSSARVRLTERTTIGRHTNGHLDCRAVNGVDEGTFATVEIRSGIVIRSPSLEPGLLA